MRRLLGLGLGLVLLWAGWWALGAQAVTQGTRALFASDARLHAPQSVDVAGFPARFDLTVKEVAFSDPRRGTGWRTPVVQLSAPSWQPWHLSATLPARQEMDLPGQTVSIAAQALGGSLVLKPGPALALDRVAASAEALDLRSTLGWDLGINTARLTTRQVEGDATRHAITLDLAGLATGGWLARAATKATLPPDVAEIALRAVAGFSAPLDRHAGNSRPALRSLVVQDSRIRWGTMTLAAAGEIAVDATGRPEGRIDLGLTNWREALQAAVALGLVTPEAAPTWERMLAMFAASSGGERLDLPLVMAGGRMSLGPLPLGPVPRIAQRQ